MVYRMVSIRAPAWGATSTRLAYFDNPKVSIRAPAWGATSISVFIRATSGFQFALPRGERHRAGQCFQQRHRFNSRSRVGSDIAAVMHQHARCSFNSRSRVGSDPAWLVFPRVSVCFNSRSRVGSDYWPRYKCCKIRVSIRAPAWGATAGDCRC